MAPAVLQAMDLSSLRAVLAELRSELLPSRFEKVQQPEPHTLQLGLRTLKGLVWLEFSWRADCPRLVRIPPPSRLGSGSTLAQQLQHGLRQMALIELKQNGFDRVVECGLA
ncbi:MAG: NFACT family protein, partial [Prochlorococcaceae cyanobacterium ETNP2_MAG_10]|nr:NFACT family protein [Prochlorococcaceae cyanobacterium ETNP2_MAG_10]